MLSAVYAVAILFVGMFTQYTEFLGEVISIFSQRHCPLVYMVPSYMCGMPPLVLAVQTVALVW